MSCGTSSETAASSRPDILFGWWDSEILPELELRRLLRKYRRGVGFKALEKITNVHHQQLGQLAQGRQPDESHNHSIGPKRRRKLSHILLLLEAGKIEKVGKDYRLKAEPVPEPGRPLPPQPVRLPPMRIAFNGYGPGITWAMPQMRPKFLPIVSRFR